MSGNPLKMLGRRATIFLFNSKPLKVLNYTIFVTFGNYFGRAKPLGYPTMVLI